MTTEATTDNMIASKKNIPAMILFLRMKNRIPMKMKIKAKMKSWMIMVFCC